MMNGALRKKEEKRKYIYIYMHICYGPQPQSHTGEWGKGYKIDDWLEGEGRGL